MAIRHVAGLAIALVVCLNASPASAEASYWKCSSDHLTVIAHSAPARCERLLGEWLRYEEVFVDLAGLEPDSALPAVTLYYLHRDDAKRYMFTEEELQEQRRARSSMHSRYFYGDEANFAVAMDQGGDEPLQSLLFLHGQQVLTYRAARSYPLWYQLGIASLLNGLVIKPDGTVVLNRKPLFNAKLESGEANADRIDVSQLLTHGTSNLSSADFNALVERAHSWAQFGLLTTPERRAGYREMALLMRQGTPLDEASMQAFGKPFADVQAEFKAGRWKSEASYVFPPTKRKASMSAPVQLTPAEQQARMQALKDRVAQ